MPYSLSRLSAQLPAVSRRRVPEGIAWGVLGALLLLLYWPLLEAGFVSDDLHYLVENRFLRELPAGELWRLLAGRANPVDFAPLRDLSYWLDLRLFGLDPWPLHLHNLLLYLGVILAAAFAGHHFMAWMEARGRPLDRRLFAFWMVLFALHPLHVEPVAWIAGRKELLAAGAVLVALGLFLRGLSGGRFGVAGAIGVPLTAVLAVLSKPTVIPLALLLPLWLWLDRRWRRGATPMAGVATGAALTVAVVGVVVVMGAGLAATLHFGRDTLMLAAPSGWEQWQGVLDRALRILGRMGQLTLLPYPLGLTYELPATGPAAWLDRGVGGALLLLGGVALWRLLRRPEPWTLGLTFALIMSATVLQLSPFSTWSMVSDRFLFLPLFGALLALISLPPPRVGLPLMALLGALYLGLTVERVGDWRSQRALVELDAQRRPHDTMAVYLWVNSVLLPDGDYQRAHYLLSGRKRPDAANPGSSVGIADPRGRRLVGRMADRVEALENPARRHRLQPALRALEFELWRLEGRFWLDLPLHKIHQQMVRLVLYARRRAG